MPVRSDRAQKSRKLSNAFGIDLLYIYLDIIALFVHNFLIKFTQQTILAHFAPIFKNLVNCVFWHLPIKF